MKESPFKHKYGSFQISWEAVWSLHDPKGGGQIKPESLRSGGVLAFSSSQICASGLSLKRSQIDPFGPGPLHPPSEKSPQNPIPIYRVRIKGTKQPVARNQGCMGEGNHPMALLKRQTPRVREIAQLSSKRALRPTGPSGPT